MILDQLIRELQWIYGEDVTADTRFNINTDDFERKPETVGELATMISAMKGEEE
mgnify:CR=1 FL=1